MIPSSSLQQGISLWFLCNNRYALSGFQTAHCFLSFHVHLRCHFIQMAAASQGAFQARFSRQPNGIPLRWQYNALRQQAADVRSPVFLPRVPSPIPARGLTTCFSHICIELASCVVLRRMCGCRAGSQAAVPSKADAQKAGSPEHLAAQLVQQAPRQISLGPASQRAGRGAAKPRQVPAHTKCASTPHMNHVSD